MSAPAETLLFYPANVIFSLVLIYLGVDIYRNKRQHGGNYLGLYAISWALVFLVYATILSLLLFQGVSNVDEYSSTQLPEIYDFLVVSVAPVLTGLSFLAMYFWLFFSIRHTTNYCGNDMKEVKFFVVSLLSLFLITGPAGNLEMIGNELLSESTFEILSRLGTFIIILGQLSGSIIGIGQIVRTTRKSPLLKAKPALCLCVPLVLSLLSIYLFMLQVVKSYSVVLSIITLNLPVLSIGLYLAVYRYDLLLTHPAAQTVGRNTILDNLESPIVAIDDDHDVAYLNSEAEELFGTSFETAAGSPIETLRLGEMNLQALTDPGKQTVTMAEHVFEVETAITTNNDDEEIGKTMTFHDITDETRQSQRIQVLNRVLRHNVRTEVQLANGYVDMISKEHDVEEHDELAKRSLERIREYSNRTGEIETLLENDGVQEEPGSLQQAVEQTVEDLGYLHSTQPRVTVDVPATVGTTLSTGLVMDVVSELVENAVTHADASAVEIGFDDTTGTLFVTDDGVGLSQQEVATLEAGEETDLQHSSGLGLWMVKWGVEQLGARLEFAVEDGTDVRITIPEKHLCEVDPEETQSGLSSAPENDTPVASTVHSEAN